VESSPGQGTTVRLVIPVAFGDAADFKYKAIQAAATLAVFPFLLLFSELSDPRMKPVYYLMAAMATAALIRFGTAWWRMRS